MAVAAGLAVALLAAGRSTRFGDADKLTAPLGERPLIQWAAEAGRAIEADHHFLVAPRNAAFNAEALGYRLRTNLQPELGLASSLKLAAEAARESQASALLILLADMPFISPDHLRRLVAEFAQDNRQPIFSIAPGTVAQPPALFPAHFFPMLEVLEGDRGARVLARDGRAVPSSSLELTDIDTLADLAAAEVHTRG